MKTTGGAAGELEQLLGRLEDLISGLETLDQPVREEVFELLDGIDVLHRMALGHLGDALGPQTLKSVREAHASIAWLFDAYGVGADEVALAERALEAVRPYIHSHGGKVEVLEAAGGVVRLKMSGSCSGCTASATTLQEGIERALRDGFPGFARAEVEEESAPAHPPPGLTLLQIQSSSDAAG